MKQSAWMFHVKQCYDSGADRGSSPEIEARADSAYAPPPTPRAKRAHEHLSEQRTAGTRGPTSRTRRARRHIEQHQRGPTSAGSADCAAACFATRLSPSSSPPDSIGCLQRRTYSRLDERPEVPRFTPSAKQSSTTAGPAPKSRHCRILEPSPRLRVHGQQAVGRP